VADHPLDALERELLQAAQRQITATAAATAARPRPRRRRTLGLGVVVASLVAAGAAWAATSLTSTGSPVPYRHGTPQPGRDLGTPVPGTVRLLTTTVPDPAGGPAWGLRTFATSRGYTCLQVGRVIDGRIGVLGADHVFHELRPGVVVDPNQCIADDGGGHAFLAVHLGQLSASADLLHCTIAHGCPKGDDGRTVDFGLLGPRAKAITYRDGKAIHTVPTLGPDAAYLVVQRHRAGHRLATPRGVLASDDYLVSLTPNSRVVARVDYGADGTCRVQPGSTPRGGCPDPPAFVPIPQPRVGDVRTTVHARLAGREIQVRFRARQAVKGSASAYNIMIYPPRTCAPQGAIGDAVEADLAAGAVVIKTMKLPCHRPGTYRVIVSYRTRAPHPQPGGVSGLKYPGTTVGHARVTIGA